MVIGIALVVVVAAVILLKNKSKKPPDTAQKAESVQTATKHGDNKGEAVTIINNGKKTKGTVIYMAEGMQVFDEDGNIVVNTTDTICNSLGYINIDGKTPGEITNPLIKKNRTWAAVAFPRSSGDEYVLWEHYINPVINITDGKISYSYKMAWAGAPGILYWGLY